MRHTYTKKEALRVMIATAKEYEKNLVGRNYLFLYRNQETHQIEYFETVFLARNFQHLTGVEFLDEQGNVRKNSVFFYRKCLSNTITEKEICFKKDGTTPLKLAVLPQVVHFLKFSKMTTFYNGARPKLALERLAGTTHYCLGFIREGNYYIPSSCLQEDIRNLGDKPSQVLAVMSKKANSSEKQYKEICYTAKGITLSNLRLPEALSQLIGWESQV